MKVAYLGKGQLSDVDLSYLHSMQTKCEIDYFLEVTPHYLKGAAINLSKCYPKTGVFSVEKAYPELSRLSTIIDKEKFFVINTPGKFWALKGIWTNILLLFRLLKGKYDVIHVTWPLNIHEFPLYLLRKKMILTVHDPFPHTGGNSFVVRLRRWFAFHLTPHFILLNEAQKNEFADYYKIPLKRISLSRLGCYNYLNYITHAKVDDLPSKYVLFFGSISPYKGLDYLMPAMVKVHQKYPDLELVVLGKGSFKFDITPYERLNYIHIHNQFIEDELLATYIKHSQFVLCPYTDATQSGVVMSAFAFSKPVIVTNVGGLPEMLMYGELGQVIIEKDTNAIANAIEFYIEHLDILSEHSQKIYKVYTKGEISWDSISDRMLDIYKK